jgi:uridine phosphorylase
MAEAASLLVGQIPLLEVNTSREAHLEPSRIHKALSIPPSAVLCFFHEVIGDLMQRGKLHQVACLRSEIGPNPVYQVEFQGRKVTVLHPGVGAPLAAAFLEEVIALGAKKVVACGGAGVLDSEIELGAVFIPESAIRDEGTSFHYLPPSREVRAPERDLKVLEQVLKRHHVPYRVSKTWTTDAIYRETPERIARRKLEGCNTVEMETSAFFAVAQFRGIRFGQYLYGGDDVGGANWDSREWNAQASVREKLFWLAVEACLDL